MMKLDEIFSLSLREIESNDQFTLKTTHLLRYGNDDVRNQVIYKKTEKVSDRLYSIVEHSSYSDNDKNIKIGKEAILDVLYYVISDMQSGQYRLSRQNHHTMDFLDLSGKLIYRLSVRISVLKKIKVSILSYLDINYTLDIAGEVEMFNKIVNNQRLLTLLKLVKSKPY